MRWIYEYGCPIRIRSDNGSEFIDDLNRLAYAIYGIQFKTGSAYSSQSQGIVERAIGSIRQALLKHSEAEPENWDLSLMEVQFQYNTTVHGWRGFTPFELLFARRVNYPLELTQEMILKDVVDEKTLDIKLRERFVLQKDLVDFLQRRRQQHLNEMRDKMSPFKKGDMVWRRINDSKGIRWEGPHKIVDVGFNSVQSTFQNKLWRSSFRDIKPVRSMTAGDLIPEVKEDEKKELEEDNVAPGQPDDEIPEHSSGTEETKVASDSAPSPRPSKRNRRKVKMRD